MAVQNSGRDSVENAGQNTGPGAGHSAESAASAGTFTIGDAGGDTGEQGLLVNRLGYGAMRLTGRGVMGDPEDREGAIAVLRGALELGINLIDTSDAYGPETNERLISDALSPYPDALSIATKGGLVRDSAGGWNPDGRPEHLREACEGSLRRLGVDRIDLYQLHSPDQRVPFEDSVWTLARLREEGKVRHVGLSNVGVRELELAIDIVPIATVQNRYSLADRSSEAVVESCEREGIGFIPYFPLAAGSLAQPGGALWEIASRKEVSPSQIALAWLLKRSPVILPIPGTSSLEHLEENVAGASIELTDEEFQELASSVAGGR